MRHFANEYDINTINVDEINSKIENVIDSFLNWVGTLDRSRNPRRLFILVDPKKFLGVISPVVVLVFLNVPGPGTWSRIVCRPIRYLKFHGPGQSVLGPWIPG